ncbi:DEAD/DEAH box helicase [bacterium SCSIO 12741]|nr:DEAD/DEAH box helicase [bacterium SCSIO 12741]
MSGFADFKISNSLLRAIEELGFEQPTPIQKKSFPLVMSGKDVVGIAQTGTGKTLAYMLPLLQDLGYSEQIHPRILVLVPTRELVLQVVENIESYAQYKTVRVLGVFGGANINQQRKALAEGADIVVATPGRLYDLALSRSVNLKTIKKLVIDEVDVMLDLGFRFQLNNLFELLPEKRQNIMYSATMTEEVDILIHDFFKLTTKISIAVSGTPLENIKQSCYPVPNFYTKINLLIHLLRDKDQFNKVVIFLSSKKLADRVFEKLEEVFGSEVCVIHSNKSQNYRIRSIRQFDEGSNRLLVATDVMARGLDLDRISHVINFDTPAFPENYMHRIGRTGRAEQEGNSILFYTPKEESDKLGIEILMDYAIPVVEFPEDVEVSEQLIPEERPKIAGKDHFRNDKAVERGPAYHEKKDKNRKVNLGGTLKRKKMAKYKKPKTRGDKNFNRRNKRGK